MPIYIVYFLTVGMIFSEGSALFDGVFELIGLPAGTRTAFIQAIASLTIIGIIFRYGMNRKMIKDLLIISLVWIPWLIYLYLRSDMLDPYTVKKLGRIFALQFVSLLYMVVAFHASRSKFERYFFPVLIGLTAILLVSFALSPSLFYRVNTGRLTFESVSPVWLARAFAVGALWLYLLRQIPYLVRIFGIACFVIGILATGSRGPLLSLLVVFSAYLLISKLNSPLFVTKAFVGLILFTAFSALMAPFAYKAVDSYLTRGHSKPIFEQSGRQYLWKQAVKDFRAAPVLGVGLGKYNKQTREGVSKSHFRRKQDFSRTYPHNIFLEVLAELGLVGLSLFFILLRPGGWMTNFSEKYTYLFWLSFLFALTSGDLPANSGLFMFNTLAILYFKYPAIGHSVRGKSAIRSRGD